MTWTTLLLLGAVAGLAAGRELLHRRRASKQAKMLHQSEGDVLRLQADLKAARIDRDYYHQRFEQSLIDLARIEADRSAYAKIAASHELQWPDAPPEPTATATPLWRDRRYAHHPLNNLEALTADLAPHLDHELTLTLRIRPMGGWESRIRALGPFEWTGPGRRVLEELRCLLLDDDTRLMTVVEGEKVWADDDSPLVFQIDLDRIEVTPPGVHIHEVEILRIQREIEERIIEQPIVIEVPTQRLGQPTPEDRIGLTREEVLALFEQQLEQKLSEFGMQRAAPSEERPLSMLSRGVVVEKKL